MKQSLLELTQDILASMDSDEVNSISDTTESMQVAEIVKQTYFNIISRVDISDHDQLIQLNPSLDETNPVLMYVPAGIGRISWLKYFNTNIIDESAAGGHDINVDITSTQDGIPIAVPGYEYVTILPVTQFIEMVNSFNPRENNVESFTFNDNSNNFNSAYTFYYKNDKQPQFCTILSNYYVIFDGYDATQDSTLQNSKTMALGQVIPTFTMTDSFIPNLSEEQFVLLLNEAKSLAYFELKQSAHPKAEQEAKRAWSSVQRDKSIINRPTYFDQLPNFGRRGLLNNGYAATSEFKSRGWDR